jgi:hypothetical protein
MALAYSESMNASLFASAEYVYQDASAPPPLRVAASVANTSGTSRSAEPLGAVT